MSGKRVGPLTVMNSACSCCAREPLSKTGLSGFQAAGRLQGPEIEPELAGAAGIRGVAGRSRPCVGRVRPALGGQTWCRAQQIVESQPQGQPLPVLVLAAVADLVIAEVPFHGAQ